MGCHVGADIGENAGEKRNAFLVESETSCQALSGRSFYHRRRATGRPQSPLAAHL